MGGATTSRGGVPRPARAAGHPLRDEVPPPFVGARHPRIDPERGHRGHAEEYRRLSSPCGTGAWIWRQRGVRCGSIVTGSTDNRTEADAPSWSTDTGVRRGCTGQQFFFQAFVYLSAAVISVPLAKRLGLGSVLGYLVAGIVIGPFALGLVGERGARRHALRRVWRGDDAVPGRPGAAAGSALAPAGSDPRAREDCRWRSRPQLFAGLGWRSDFAWQTALACGMILALSSTAIVLQTLNEKGLMKTDAGPGLVRGAALPGHRGDPDAGAAATAGDRGPGSWHMGPAAGESHGSTWWLEELSGVGRRPWPCSGRWRAIVVGGRFLIRPAFRFIAKHAACARSSPPRRCCWSSASRC